VAASKDKARAILSYATPNPVGPYKLVTPPTPDLGAGKTKTPVLPVMGGTLVNLPTPVMPTKQVTPVAPPLPDKLVNVPKQQGRVVDRLSPADIKVIQQFEKNIMPDDLDALAKHAAFFERIKDKKIRAMYEDERRIWLKEGDTPEMAAMQAADFVNQRIVAALQTGFKPEILGDLDINDISAVSRIIRSNPDPKGWRGPPISSIIKSLDADEQLTLAALAYKWRHTPMGLVDAVKSLNKREQETLRGIAPGWTGNAEQLIDAARSLSK
jgi:hypothetical protein